MSDVITFSAICSLYARDFDTGICPFYIVAFEKGSGLGRNLQLLSPLHINTRSYYYFLMSVAAKCMYRGYGRKLQLLYVIVLVLIGAVVSCFSAGQIFGGPDWVGCEVGIRVGNGN
jgi:hypothetical protein